MEGNEDGKKLKFLDWLGSVVRKFVVRVLAMGPLPNHIAFIMDGNRRYASKEKMETRAGGHEAGFSALMRMLNYCYELGVRYVTIYAFSIDNFKRKPEEVQNIMDLMLEKTEELLEKESIVNQLGIRVYFVGNLKLLAEPVRVAMDRAMRATETNSKHTLVICVAYTSRDEIVHAVEESCKHKWEEIRRSKSIRDNFSFINGVRDHDDDEEVGGTKVTTVSNKSDLIRVLEGDEGGESPTIQVVEIEKNMYMKVAPDPDILIRSSGETRLSNFLLWQTSHCLLYSPRALWPEIGFSHLVWSVLNFQRHHLYLEKKKKEM